jgi:nucleotide-binding universal stress UspA family protein
MASIVVGIDGTEASRSALRWATAEARLRGASLHVVHTWPHPIEAYGPSPRMSERFPSDTVAAEHRIAKELVEREFERTGIEATGVSIEAELVEGEPARVLLAAAQDADLLVIGSSRHGTVASVILGAVAEQCVRHAPCPVVIVRKSQ